MSLNQLTFFRPFDDVKAQPIPDSDVVYGRQWGKCGTNDGDFSGEGCTMFYASSTIGPNGTHNIYSETFGHGPVGIATDEFGNVFVTDPDRNRIQKFTSNGTFVTKWSERAENYGQSFKPTGIATDNAGNVYVVEPSEDRIQKFTSNGTFVTKWGQFGRGDGELLRPMGIATDNAGNVYVVDTLNNRIQKFTSNGTFVTKWGQSGEGNGQFDFEFLAKFIGITTDNAGNVYVVDGFNDRIQKFTSNGTFVTKWGQSGEGNGEFIQPTGIAIDKAGNVYVADIGISTGVGDLRDQNTTRIQKFTSNGTFVTKWGQYGEGNGQFSIPLGVAVDSKGLIYIADYLNSRIQEFQIK
jgi:tripartite motif-containing protein 71